MVTLAMEGIIVQQDGKLLRVLAASENAGQDLLHIEWEGGDLRASPQDLYRRGYRLVAAKPAIWNLWGRAVYGTNDGKPWMARGDTARRRSRVHLWDEARPWRN